jgi:hypothetical protein
MNEIQLKEIEELAQNPTVDKSVLATLLIECVDEIRKLKTYLEDIEVKRHAKIGDRIRIQANTNEHGFEIGDTVIVIDWEDCDDEDGEFGVEAKHLYGGDSWFVLHSDYVVLEKRNPNMSNET